MCNKENEVTYVPVELIINSINALWETKNTPEGKIGNTQDAAQHVCSYLGEE